MALFKKKRPEERSDSSSLRQTPSPFEQLFERDVAIASQYVAIAKSGAPTTDAIDSLLVTKRSFTQTEWITAGMIDQIRARVVRDELSNIITFF